MNTITVTENDLKKLSQHKLGGVKLNRLALGLSYYLGQQGEGSWAVALEQMMDELRGSRLAWDASLTGISAMSADEWVRLLPADPANGDEVMLTGVTIKSDGRVSGTLIACPLESWSDKGPAYVKVRLKYDGVLWKVTAQSGTHAVALVKASLKGCFIKESWGNRLSRVSYSSELVSLGHEVKQDPKKIISKIFKERWGRVPQRGDQVTIGGAQMRSGKVNGSLAVYRWSWQGKGNASAEIHLKYNGDTWDVVGHSGTRADVLLADLLKGNLVTESLCHRFSRVRGLPEIIGLASEMHQAPEVFISKMFKEKWRREPVEGDKIWVGGAQILLDKISGSLGLYSERWQPKGRSRAAVCLRYRDGVWRLTSRLGSRAKHLRDTLLEAAWVKSSVYNVMPVSLMVNST